MRLRSGRKPATLALLASVALAGSVGGVGTYALWSDATTVTGVEISAGELNLTIDGEDSATVEWSGLLMDGMAPGESAAGVMVMENVGDVGFAVDVLGSANGNLRTHLEVRIVLEGTATSDDTYPRTEECQGGVETYGEPLTQVPELIVDSTSLLYSSALAAGSSKTLCVQITLPEDANNNAQRQTYTPTFDFTATQS